MKLGKQIAKITIGGALMALMALPAFAQVRGVVVGPHGAAVIVGHHRRYHHHYYRHHVYRSTTLYMAPNGERRYYSHGNWYYR